MRPRANRLSSTTGRAIPAWPGTRTRDRMMRVGGRFSARMRDAVIQGAQVCTAAKARIRLCVKDRDYKLKIDQSEQKELKFLFSAWSIFNFQSLIS